MFEAPGLLFGPSAWLPAVIVAPFIGSFLGVVARRLPGDASIILGRSRCDSCGHGLAVADLVPLVSFASCGGRCRYCGERISLSAPAIELAAVGVAVWASTVTSGSDLWLTCLLGWWLLVLGWIDAETMLLPDSLTVPLLLAGIVAGGWLDPAIMPDRLLAAAIGYLLLYGVARIYAALRGREGLGLGDAKLLAAIGAWLGLSALPSTLFLAACLGLGAAGVMRLAGRGIGAATAIPFGPFLAAAAWLVWLYGERINGLLDIYAN